MPHNPKPIKTSMAINRSTLDKLDAIAIYPESYESIVLRLLDYKNNGVLTKPLEKPSGET